MWFKKGIFYSLFLYLQINKHTNTGDSFLTSVCLTSLQQRPLHSVLHSPWFIHTSLRLNQCFAAPVCGRERHVQSFRLQLNSNHFFVSIQTNSKNGLLPVAVHDSILSVRWFWTGGSKAGHRLVKGWTAFKNKSIRLLLDFKYLLEFFVEDLGRILNILSFQMWCTLNRQVEWIRCFLHPK